MLNQDVRNWVRFQHTIERLEKRVSDKLKLALKTEHLKTEQNLDLKTGFEKLNSRFQLHKRYKDNSLLLSNLINIPFFMNVSKHRDFVVGSLGRLGLTEGRSFIRRETA